MNDEETLESVKQMLARLGRHIQLTNEVCREHRKWSWPIWWVAAKILIVSFKISASITLGLAKLMFISSSRASGFTPKAMEEIRRRSAVEGLVPNHSLDNDQAGPSNIH